MLADGKRFNHELGHVADNVETLCFFGRKKPTISGGTVFFGAENTWQHVVWETTTFGDGTVPEQSAFDNNARAIYPFSVGHGEIYVNPAVLDVLEWELYGKFHMAKRVMLVNPHFSVTFETDKDVFRPGEKIQVWVTVFHDSEGDHPISRAQVRTQLVWRQSLPGSKGRFISQLSRGFMLSESQSIPGRYDGMIEAPMVEGYYDFHTAVSVSGQPPMLLNDMVIVEEET
jgi:hypothetical protein